ncbi:hypothetical protein K488DRAFT_56990, partial [Vararia minispora EC-137]
PAYVPADAEIYRPEVLATIEECLDSLDDDLRKLSLKIHDNPQLNFEETIAHDALTAFMAKHGFTVTKSYLGLQTAFRAEFANGDGGRTLGVNSEMDALPGIGHACGHNLIAAAGAGVAVAVKAALIKHGISGRVVLLGTPAEEGGCGKGILLERGGYEGMDACVMCHPSAGTDEHTMVTSSLALQMMEIEYHGRTAHAGAQPWQGINALDAAVLAYTSISALRQQVKPDHRLHGTLAGRNWAANVIPDYAKMIWICRAPTWAEVEALRDRVISCLKAAAMATGCEYNLEFKRPYYDLRMNKVLGNDYLAITRARYDVPSRWDVATSASTDFGNVSYALPSLHPGFTILTDGDVSQNGNHTVGFAKAAGTLRAHKASMLVMKGLAHTGLRVLDDDNFYREVRLASPLLAYSWQRSDDVRR